MTKSLEITTTSERKMFHVVNWDTREILSSWEKPAIAKRWARFQGHTGEDTPGLTGYPPIAYVADGNGDCVYNPRFGKNEAMYLISVDGKDLSLPMDLETSDYWLETLEELMPSSVILRYCEEWKMEEFISSKPEQIRPSRLAA